MFKRIISLTLTLSFLLQQTVFAYSANLNLSNYLNSGTSQIASDRYRPVSLRYFSYQVQTNDFKVLLDKGDSQEPSLHSRGAEGFKQEAAVLLDYFKIGLSLPNDKFWVNLRPDSRDEIIDEQLAKTDLGKVMLEADLKLKQDTSLFTSPQSPQGKEYWNKLYKKAGELFGTENITIPTLTRPWIVPGEIILRESNDKSSQGAYIYKANLKVMLEEDYLEGGSRTAPTSALSRGRSRTAPTSAFSDPRLKELNSYSTQLIKELILPRLTQKVNSSKDYANLRQVYFSLILARWFKETFSPQSTIHISRADPYITYIKLIDSNNLTNLASKTPWDKTTYFNAYQKSFQEGEYNLSEAIHTPTGQVIRRYMSGGMIGMPTKEQIKNGFGGELKITSSAVEAKGKVLLDSELKVERAGDIQAEDQENMIIDSLERSREALNHLIEEMTKVKDGNGNENQALTSLLTVLSEQLLKIDKIGVSLQPEGALGTLEKALKDLKKYEPSLNVNLFLRSEIIHTTVPALESTIKILRESHGSSSAMEASKKTEGSEIISAVKSLQDKLPDDGNEQLLKFAANINPNGELEYPLKKNDRVMIGHVRGDRAWYLARGLQEKGFDKLLGYIKFNKDFEGISVLPEEAVGEISNTFFERISNLGYTSVRISEDEKKEHTGYNANGRNEQPFPGERRVVIKMQKSSKAYVDTPEMRMKEVADAALTELDGNVDFILTNFLSSDMMKHTGNFEAAKKSNEITDQQLGKIKDKIDAIKVGIIERMEREIERHFLDSKLKAELSRFLNTNYDKFLETIISDKNHDAFTSIKSLEEKVPLFVITADHGASEAGLKENPKESDTFHSPNPVPYIIYDPLRKQKIPLRVGKTIRNNAATLLQLLGEEIPQEYDESLLPTDYQGSKRRIAFAVLDGWGINPDQNHPYDAIRLADTSNYDWFVKNASFTQIDARGEVIGLRKMLSYEEGPHHLRGLQAGQTDIGHIHLFSGREVKQPLWYMDQLIQGGLSNGVFDETKEEVKLLIGELNEVKEKGLKFHYITVGSEGGVHASLYHMYALMRLAKKAGLAKDQFVIHFAADGRDVPTRTAHLYLEDVYKRIEEIGIGVVSVVFGRDMLVRKEGAENITNRLIEVMSGVNLNSEDVTLVKKTSESEDNSNAIIRNLQKVYNRIAPEYSDIWGDDVQEEVKRHREAFLEIIPKNAAVVDVGTGPGRDTAWFNDHGLQAVGIDFSKEIITQAQKRHPELKFQQMDMRRLEFESNSVDGIWDNGAFHHLPPDAARQAFKEFYRVMKSDGVLFLRVKQGDGEEFQPDKKYPNETRYFKFYQKDEIENLAASQGFEIIKSGSEIDSKKPEQTWVYLFAKKVYSTGSPLTVDDLKKIEWRNVLLGSLQEIFEERLRKMDEYHGKMFMMENFWDPFIMARSDKQKIKVIEEAIDVARLYWEAPSETEKTNRKELRNFLTGSFDSYFQKILSEIKDTFSDPGIRLLSNIVFTTTAELENKRKFLLKQINEIEAYYFGEKGQAVDYRSVFSMPGRLNWAIRVHKMMRDEVSLKNILEQSVPSASSAMMPEDQTGQTSGKKVVGGIDFRQMNMLIQPQGSFASSSLDFSLPLLSKAEIEGFDLDKELANIQKMSSSGIAPSYQRLKEYLAVCFAKQRTGQDIDNLKLCLLDIFEKEQFEAKETPDGYKEVLVIADTKGYVLSDSRLAASEYNSYSLN